MEEIEAGKSLSTECFTKEHKTISSQFLDKVLLTLKQPGIRPKTYAIDECDYSGIRESIKIQINEKTVLEINLKVSK